ncbi:proline dehydrogenase [Larkinella rosea]|uniref:Proline dehydrogenase n=2 Tax=Larkinella rosea TaxID=2025312 RepID=A0A3P1BAU9_9BACT|nr:proline dehydrogenase [Larkinella rosea]
MKIKSIVPLDNTADAFAYKSDTQLRKANALFYLMNQNWLVKLGAKLTELAVQWRLPVKSLIRSTIFEQFVGGETLDETTGLIEKLNQFNVKVILDYGAEGKATEADFDTIKEEFIRVITYASNRPNVPLIGIKITALARFELLEKLNELALVSRFNTVIDTSPLTAAEKQEWDRVVRRTVEICTAAAQKGIGILIDAEESWIQNTIDALTMEIMLAFNKEKAVVFNTIQLYRHDRLDFLKLSHALASKNGAFLGAKIVRGAYMEKERKRAQERQETVLIQPDKAACDVDFNKAIDFCIDHLDTVSLIVASHNEYSVQYAVNLLRARYFPLDHPHVHFSQLYGMSDHITFNLAKAGCQVSKYLPYGPIADVIPYLMRRAQENSSVAGQTSRELFLIRKEIRRRHL